MGDAMPDFLPYGRQTIEADDVAAVAAALTDDYLTTGPRVEAYEAAFAQAAGAAHAVASNSGTAALHLPLLALGLGPGEAVVVPSITFVATANVVRMTGAEVVFADVDPMTGLMTPDTLRAALAETPPAGTRIVGAMPVHLNGQLCDMAGLGALAAERGLWLVEDACHAIGAAAAGACRHSRAAAFSTHPVKGITTGEGGVTTTADPALADHMRRLRSHGLVREPASFMRPDMAFEDGQTQPWYYELPEIGWNYRIPDVLCALGLSQLAKLPRLHARRAHLAGLYARLVAPLAPGIALVPRGERPDGWHLLVALIDFARFGTTRAQVMAALRREAIGTQVHYIPVHEQPYYRDRYGPRRLAGADAYYARCLSLPFFPQMTDDDVARVAAALKRSVGA
ncbi:UDP-4-amino-4,6-dideoxy-N-acetyl-beta-L-altrosamine transaminase [Blastochloris tepida]|nr:UDP-4-amino-4,6-dideoxy-N-acetyl-beta-L-altrosamine transaminase [Blastochloris tepida]